MLRNEAQHMREVGREEQGLVAEELHDNSHLEHSEERVRMNL